MIYDELEYAEILIEKKDIKKFTQQDIIILAKYFDSIGIKKQDIREKILDFCNSQQIEFNEISYGWLVDNALKNIKNYKLRIPSQINITKDELDYIGQIGDFKEERVMFVLLCVSKYIKYTNTKKNPKNDNYDGDLFFNGKRSEIFREARYNKNASHKKEIFYKFNQMNLVETFQRRGGGSVLKIKIYSPQSEPVIWFSEIKDIYKLYLGYKEDKIIRCNHCGDSIVKNSNRHKMCAKCFDSRRKEYFSNRKFAQLEND